MPLQLFKFEITSEKEKGKDGGTKHKTMISFDTEDIIAFFAGAVAVLIVVGMLAHWVPVDKLTVSIASLSGVGAGVAKIVQARRGKKPKKP
jgi:hypothetical protein